MKWRSGKVRRRIIRAILGSLALLVVLLLLTPFWFQWALRTILLDHGVSFDRYQRIGYTRFSITRVKLENPSASFQVEKVEAFQPIAWLWHRYFIGTNAADPYLRVENWRLEPKSAIGSPRTPKARAPDSLAHILDEIRAKAPVARAWMPSAQLTNGVIMLGSKSIMVPGITWKDGRLSASVAAEKSAPTLSLDLDLSHDNLVAVSAVAIPFDLKTDLHLVKEATEWKLNGEILWKTNRATVQCVLGQDSLLPRTARLEATQFSIPADQLQLNAYRDLTGSCQFAWAKGQFDLTANASAEPASTNTNSLPPFHIEINVTGNPRDAVARKFHVDTPWLQVDLTDNAQIVYTREIIREKALLKLDLDLGKFRHPGYGGSVQAQVRLEPATNDFPRAQFEISGSKLTARDIEIADIRANGTLVWPMLTVTAEGKTTNGLAFSAVGHADLVAHQIVESKWQIESRNPVSLLPAQITFQKLHAYGTMSGPWDTISHSVEINIEGLSTTIFRAAIAKAKWDGRGSSIESVGIEISAGQSIITAQGSAQLMGKRNVKLDKLVMTHGAETIYQLAQPSRVELERRDRGETALVGNLQWKGEKRDLRIGLDTLFPRRGKLEMIAGGVAVRDFGDFLVSTNDIELSQLALSLDWDGGPALSKLGLQGTFVLPDGTRASANGTIHGDGKGLTIELAALHAETGQVFSVHGTLPVRITPARWPRWWDVDATERIDLVASTAPNASFWKRIDEMTGIRLVEPKLDLALSGTLAKPEGAVRMSAESVELGSIKFAKRLPRIGDLAFNATITPDRLELKELRLNVEAQPVSLQASVPMDRNAWTDLLKRRQPPDWRNATVHLQIADASLAPFTPYLPTVLAPQGRLTVDLAFQPGGKLDGKLKLAGAATRPLDPVGPIREIEAEVRFLGRNAQVEKFQGLLGGETVNLTGSIQIAEKNRITFTLALRGENVPLARQPGLILRSDINLDIVRTNDQPAMISGEIKLRKSLLVRELGLLKPGKLDRFTRSAPYIEVKEPPFNDWTVNLKIQGDRFLHVRSPVFSGDVSASFDLQGPLSGPTALGEARINSGLILFPFATMKLDSGSVSLTSAEPHRPQVYITGSGRSFGYNVQMEVRGYADDPRVQFTSVPPLSSEEILLMVTAGELPRQEFSLSSRERASRLAFYLGRDLLMRLGIGQTAAERLSIVSGEDISEAGNPTYHVEYNFTDRWAAFGEYDRFNAFNAGLKFRLYSK